MSQKFHFIQKSHRIFFKIRMSINISSIVINNPIRKVLQIYVWNSKLVGFVGKENQSFYNEFT